MKREEQKIENTWKMEDMYSSDQAIDVYKRQGLWYVWNEVTTMIKRMDTVFEIKNKKLKRTDYYA